MFEPQYIAFDCFHLFLTLATVETAAEHVRALEQFRLYLRFCHTRNSSFHRSKVIQLAARQPLADRAAPRSLMRSLVRDESLSCHQYFCRPRLSFTFTSCMVFTAGSMSESSRRSKDGEVPDPGQVGVSENGGYSISLPKRQFNIRSL